MNAPAEWVVTHFDGLAEAARHGAVVDLACGRGRNALPLARRGIPVTGLDRNAEHLAELAATVRAEGLPIGLARADFEAPGSQLPLGPKSCAALLVCRYLHRPLCPALEEALRPGGWLLYETFTVHQRKLGHGPRNPDFLLSDGELPELFPRLETVDAWEGTTEGSKPEAVARLWARRTED